MELAYKININLRLIAYKDNSFISIILASNTNYLISYGQFTIIKNEASKRTKKIENTITLGQRIKRTTIRSLERVLNFQPRLSSAGVNCFNTIAWPSQHSLLRLFLHARV